MPTLAATAESQLLRDLDRPHLKIWRPTQEPIAGISRSQQREAAHRLAKQGLLERLERGTYLVVPRSGARLVPPLELVGAWFGEEAHSVIGAMAAEYHGLTYDTPSSVEVQLARTKAEAVAFQGKLYRFSRSTEASVAFDNVMVKLGGVVTQVASPGKLLILLLNQHRRGNGTTKGSRLALEVLERGLQSGTWRRVPWTRLIARHGTAATARRLGYLLEHYKVPGSEKLLALRGRAGYTVFSSLHPADGPINPRWRLLLNDPMVQIANAHPHS